MAEEQIPSSTRIFREADEEVDAKLLALDQALEMDGRMPIQTATGVLIDKGGALEGGRGESAVSANGAIESSEDGARVNGKDKAEHPRAREAGVREDPCSQDMTLHAGKVENAT